MNEDMQNEVMQNEVMQNEDIQQELIEFGYSIKELEAMVEGLLFAAGDPVPLEKIAEILGIDKQQVKQLLANISDSCKSEGRGIMLREIDNAFTFCTKPEYHSVISKLYGQRIKSGLSQAAYETAAIIAFAGKATRVRIEQVRGVNSDSALERLIERGLVTEAGRLDTPGKPILYETTQEFLKLFGLRSLVEFRDIATQSDVLDLGEGIGLN